MYRSHMKSRGAAGGLAPNPLLSNANTNSPGPNALQKPSQRVSTVTAHQRSGEENQVQPPSQPQPQLQSQARSGPTQTQRRSEPVPVVERPPPAAATTAVGRRSSRDDSWRSKRQRTEAPQTKPQASRVSTVTQKQASKSQRNVTRVPPIKSEFLQIIDKHGFILKEKPSDGGEGRGSEPFVCNQLDVDQNLFIRNLEEELTKDLDLKQKVIDSMITFFEDIDIYGLKVCCCQTLSSATCVSSRGSRQDSFIKILLNSDVIQVELLRILFQRLLDFVSDSSRRSQDREQFAMFSLLLCQFRCIEKIEDPNEFVDQLIDSLQTGSVEVQKQIVLIIPHLIPSMEDLSDDMVQRFIQLVEEENLRSEVLEALSYMSPNTEQMRQFLEAVNECMPITKLHQLPEVIKFLLESASPDDCLKTFDSIRKCINDALEVSEKPIRVALWGRAKPTSGKRRRGSQIITSTPDARGRDGNLEASRIYEEGARAMSRIVDSILLASRNNAKRKLVIETVIASITRLSKALCIFDCLLLFSLLYRSPYQRRPIESLIMAKVKVGAISEIQMNEIFVKYVTFFEPIYKNRSEKEKIKSNLDACFALLEMAKKFLKQTDPRISDFSGQLYANCFLKIEDKLVKWEVITCLVSHIASGTDNETSNGLDVLLDLSEKDPEKAVHFVHQIKSLLDSLEQLTVKQISAVYRCLSLLSTQSESLVEDLDITLRKQLTSPNTGISSIGVIGSVAFISVFNIYPREEVPVVSIEEPSIIQGPSRRATSLIPSQVDTKFATLKLVEFIEQEAKSRPDMFSLFCDLLAEKIKNSSVDASLMDKIKEDYYQQFEECFTLEVPKGTQMSASDTFVYGADDVHVERAINLKSTRVSFLASLFRLLTAVNSQETPDDRLNLPQYFVSPVTYGAETVKKETKFLWFALNWFREAINTFADVTRSEDIKLICRRLNDCVVIENRVTNHTEEDDWRLLPKVVFEPECISRNRKVLADDAKKYSPKKPKNKLKRKPIKRKPKKRADPYLDEMANREHDDNQEEEEEEEEEAAAEEDEDDEDEYDDNESNLIFDEKRLKACSRLMRCFDWKTFHLLKYYKEIQGVQLSRAALLYMMNELQWKLASVIPKGTGKYSRVTALFWEQIKFIVKDIGVVLLEMVQDIESHKAMLTSLILCLTMSLQLLLEQNEILVEELMQEVVESLPRGEMLTQQGDPFLDYNNRLTPLYNNIGKINDASMYLQLVGVLINVCPQETSKDEMKSKLSDTAHFYMKKNWPKVEIKHLRVIFETFFKHSSDPRAGLKQVGTYLVNKLAPDDVQTLCQLPKSILKTLQNKLPPNMAEFIATSQRSQLTYPAVTAATFPLIFEILFKTLVADVNKHELVKDLKASNSKMECLTQWYISVCSLHVFLNLVKLKGKFDKNCNQRTCLKFGRLFVEAFIKRAMPLLNHMFPKHRNDVLDLLHAFQMCTRMLQNFCVHVKVNKETALIGYIPSLRRKLEEFIYDVKAMLTLYNCKDAIQFKILKNRDLYGVEIHGYQNSQMSEASLPSFSSTMSSQASAESITDTASRRKPKKRSNRIYSSEDEEEDGGIINTESDSSNSSQIESHLYEQSSGPDL